MSHNANVKEADETVEARLLRLLGREAEWLYRERYQRGLVWLGRWYDTSTELYQALEGHTLFWKWWVNDWQARDADFNHRLKVDATGKATYTANSAGSLLFFQQRESLEDFYISLHDPHKTSISVPAIIMDMVKQELRKKRTDKTFSAIFSNPQNEDPK